MNESRDRSQSRINDTIVEDLQQIIEACPTGIALVEESTHRIVRVNELLLQLSGYAHIDILFMPFDQLTGSLDVDLPIQLSRVRSTDRIVTMLRCKDGHGRPVLQSSAWVRLGGDLFRIESFTDIADIVRASEDLEASKEKLRVTKEKYGGIINNIGVGIAMISPDMEILEVNRQMREWFPHIETAKRPKCHYAYNDPPRAEPCHYCPVVQTFADGQVHESITSTPCGDEIRNYNIVSSPIHNASGEIVAAIEMVKDVTEQEARARQSRQAQKLEAIGQLAAGIAHEVNTPAQYVGDNLRFLIESFADLLQLLRRYRALKANVASTAVDTEDVRDLDKAEQAADIDFLIDEIPEALKQGLEGIERVAQIVNAMKEFSHPGGDEMKHVDLNQALRSTLVVARNEWKYCAEVVTELDESLPSVPCLPGDINQVFLNLVVNAAHAIIAAQGGETTTKGRIRIATVRDNDHAVIKISDTGTGIPAEIAERVFDPFFTTKGVGKGTGQGLSLARNVVVDKHNGSIDFDSRAGEGTTFTVRLPLEQNFSRIAESATA